MIENMMAPAEVGIRARLLDAGRKMFSENGYDGASVRQICDHASASLNMINHYFGSKRGLFDVILAEFSENVFSVPLRVISEPPRSRENLIARMEIFFSETLEALVANREVWEIVVRERIVTQPFLAYNDHMVAFFESAKSAGLIRKELDSAMLTGLIFDRLGPQVSYAYWIKDYSGENILEPGPYRDRWLRANIDLILNGILG